MGLQLSRAIGDLSEGQRIIPVLRAAFASPSWQGFDVRVPEWEARPYDGWFHPSTHATWTARQLALYVRYGDRFPAEEPDINFVLAVTQGRFWHEIIQRTMLRSGLLLRNEGTTWDDPIEDQCELRLVDPLHNVKGHADGRMADDEELFELKTTSGYKIEKLTNERVLKELNPFGYYSQAQDYLAISGREKSRMLIVSMSGGFRMTEFVIHADRPFQRAQRTKYRQAIEAAQTGRWPDPCCHPGSAQARACPAREFCEIGRLSR